MTKTIIIPKLNRFIISQYHEWPQNTTENECSFIKSVYLLHFLTIIQRGIIGVLLILLTLGILCYHICCAKDMSWPTMSIWLVLYNLEIGPLSLILRILYQLLTHRSRVTHICVDKLTIIGSDYDLSPVRCQAIIWTNARLLSIGTLGTNFSELVIDIYIFSFQKCIWNWRQVIGDHFF